MGGNAARVVYFVVSAFGADPAWYNTIEEAKAYLEDTGETEAEVFEARLIGNLEMQAHFTRLPEGDGA